MAVTYNAAVKTARMNAVRTYFDNGTIEIQKSDGTVIAVFGLQSPPGSVTGSVWTLTPLDAATVTAVSTNVAAIAVVKNSTAAAHITGLTVTATGGGGDIQLDNTNITTGQSVTMNTATITHA